MKTLLISLVTFISFTSLTFAAADRNVWEYNLTNRTGLKGYDPVSYFPDGGSVPLQGSSTFQLEHEGVIYSFATWENLDLFKVNPDKYEPTYGGWCAYAMASGAKVDIQPLLYTIHGNRLHLFVAKRAKQNFDADVAGYEGRADAHWKAISGEAPRQ